MRLRHQGLLNGPSPRLPDSLRKIKHEHLGVLYESNALRFFASVRECRGKRVFIVKERRHRAKLDRNKQRFN